jgi:hypothetical protein
MVIVPNDYYDEFDDVLIQWYEENGVIWYKMYCIASAFGYNDSLIKDTWEKQIDDRDKCMFEEETEDFRGNVYTYECRYINTKALFKLLDRYEKVVGKLRKHVCKIERERGYLNETDDKNQRLKVNLGILDECINNPDYDYDRLYNVSKEILEAELIQQIYYSNPVKEEIISKFREDVYSYDDYEEISWNMKPIDNEEVNKVYKRHPKCNEVSTCPNWIRDVIK